MKPAPMLIATDAQACRRCWRCAHRCPAHAVRVNGDGSVETIHEKCVGCGLCVTQCPHGARQVRDGAGTLDELLASGRPVVALLATEFAAALYPRAPEAVEAALENAGFLAVESTLLGEEAVALAYEERHAIGNGLPVIRSTCPVVNEWVRTRHPALVGALAPLVPPYVAQARLIKALYADDAAVVYVSPCYAKKDEALSDEFDGAIDVALDFIELERALGKIEHGTGGRSPVAVGRLTGTRRPEPPKELSLTDGYPRSTMTSRDMTASDVTVVRGLVELEGVLRGIEAGEAAPLIVDALNCEGCLDGPAVSPGMSLFVKRDLQAAERGRRGRSSVSSREVLRHSPSLDLRRSFSQSPIRLPRPDDDRLREILHEGGITGSGLDCGACGYSTCAEYAVGIFRGEVTWESCLPLQQQNLVDKVGWLQESATLDALTGLWSRRVFSQRLDEEFARHKRYGGPIALLMLDLDEFKGINDRYGHVCGDAVLVSVADALRAELRAIDLPCRYGGDEFAVVLPATSKTEAFAVAERLRLAVEATVVRCMCDGHDTMVDVRLSAGVASAGADTKEPVDLLEAADRALYRAKANGRNQVRLAPG